MEASKADAITPCAPFSHSVDNPNKVTGRPMARGADEDAEAGVQWGGVAAAGGAGGDSEAAWMSGAASAAVAVGSSDGEDAGRAGESNRNAAPAKSVC